MAPVLDLDLLPGDLAIARLPGDAAVPAWAEAGEPLVATVRMGDELSLVVPAGVVPRDARHEGPYRALRVRGPLAFDATGIMAVLAGALADAGIWLFAVSTFETDVLLVPAGDVPGAARALRAAGHRVHGPLG